MSTLSHARMVIHSGGADVRPYSSCACGWSSGAQFQIDQAASAMNRHVKNIIKPIEAKVEKINV